MPSKLSTEYIRVPVTATKAGAPYNPTADVVQLAVIASGATPVTTDWKTGDWETVGATYYARLLVGPTSGNLDFSASPGMRQVWVKITDSPEVPVVSAGPIYFT